MFADFDKTVIKAVVDVRFLKANYGPASLSKKDILNFIKSPPFWQGMPIISINFYHRVVLWQGKVTRIFSDTRLRVKRYFQFSQYVGDNPLWFCGAVVVRTNPGTQALTGAKAECSRYGELHPHFLAAISTGLKDSFPEWVCGAKDRCFELMATFAAAKMLTIRIGHALVDLIGLPALLAGKGYLLLSVPSRFTSDRLVCLKDVYASLRIWSSASLLAAECITALLRTKLALALPQDRRYGLKASSALKAMTGDAYSAIWSWEFSPIHDSSIAQIMVGYNRSIITEGS